MAEFTCSERAAVAGAMALTPRHTWGFILVRISHPL